MSDDRLDDLFARVRPLVGEALEQCTVAVVGSAAGGALVEYLVACGVRRWLALAGNEWIEPKLAALRARYDGMIDVRLESCALVEALGAADLAIVVDDSAAAGRLPLTLPRLAIFTPAGGQPSRAYMALAGEAFDLPELPASCPYDGWDWLTAAPLMALVARALLLRGTPYAMVAWEEGWAKGYRGYRVGAGYDPTRAGWMARNEGEGSRLSIYRTPYQRKGTLLVVGLGSLGSMAARQLAPFVKRLVLVDPDQVEMANLVRQTYTHDQLGEAKAMALAALLRRMQPGLICEAVVDALRDEEETAELIERFGVTAALVTTGTHFDFAITRALRAAGLPHVVGRCYGRARFWEGIVVDGAQGLSYEQVRRGVAAGPAPAPTPEEMAAYGAVGELAGEPATMIETGWAAMWLARLTAQMMMPANLREGWLLARLAAGANCLIGGLVVEEVVEESGDTDGAGGAAYGVTVPGEVHAWSVAEMA